MPMGAWHDGPKPESDGRLGLGHDRTHGSERLYATVGVYDGVRRATPRLHVAIGMAMARRILNATKFQDYSTIGVAGLAKPTMLPRPFRGGAGSISVGAPPSMIFFFYSKRINMRDRPHLEASPGR